MKARMFITIILAAAALQGCVFAVDSGPDDDRFSRRGDSVAGTPTIGQELLDLDRARAAGAISRAEYDRLKALIIENAESER